MKLLVLHGSKNRPSTVQLDYVNLAQLQREDVWLNHMYEYLVNNTLPVEPELARDIAAQRSLYIIENNVLHCIFSVESSHRRHETRKLVAVPRSHINTVLMSMHCNIEGSHLGIDRTYEKIRLHFHWPTMYADIRRFVKECATCAKKKLPVRSPVGHLMPIRAQGAWDIVGIDVLGPLPITQSKHRYIVVFTDYLTKWVEAFPIREADSQTIARLFVMEIITRFGAPRKLISDRGTVFMSELSTAIYEFMNIKKMFTTPYHPQTDGLTERFNKTAAQMLTAYVNENQTNWDQILPLSLLAYRTARQSSTRETPFFMTYGRDAFLPLNRIFLSELDEEITESEYTAKLLENLKSAYRTADINETTAKTAQERNHNIGRVPITFKVNSLVWYYSPKRVKNQVQKLSPLWTGPFIVSQQLSPTVYLLENIDTGKKFTANIQRIKSSNISFAEAKKLHLKGLQLREKTDQKGEEVPEIPTTLTPEQQKFLDQVEAVEKFDLFETSKEQTELITNDELATKVEDQVVAQLVKEEAEFIVSPEDEVFPSVPTKVSQFFDVLFRMYTTFRDIATFKVNKMSQQLDVFFDKPFVPGSTERKKLMQELKIAKKSRPAMLKFLLDCTKNFNTKFSASIDRHPDMPSI